jgi:hypothetical protein
MRYAASLLLLILWSSPVLAADPPLQVKKFFAVLKAQNGAIRVSHIRQAKQIELELKKTMLQYRMARTTKQKSNLAAKIKKLREDGRKKLTSIPKVTIPTLILPVKIGAMGKLSNDSVVVTQLRGKDAFLGDVTWSTTKYIRLNNRLVPKAIPGKQSFWFEGIPTDKLAVGAIVEVSDILDVVGKKTYKTAKGTITVPLVKPFSYSEVEKFLPKK